MYKLYCYVYVSLVTSNMGVSVICARQNVTKPLNFLYSVIQRQNRSYARDNIILFVAFFNIF